MSYGMTKSPPSRTRPRPPSFLTETPSSSGADADTGRFHVQRQEQMTPKRLPVTSITHSRSLVIDQSPGSRRGSKLPTLGASASVPELQSHVPAEVTKQEVVQALAMPLGRRLTTRWSSLELASLDTLKSAVEKSLEDGRMQEKVRLRAVSQHQVAKQGANEAWAELRFADCLAHLSKSLDVDSRCDVRHRFRTIPNVDLNPTPIPIPKPKPNPNPRNNTNPNPNPNPRCCTATARTATRGSDHTPSR